MQKIYNFSEISYNILKEIAHFHQVRSQDIFEEWFSFDYKIDKLDEEILLKLIKANEYNIDFYSELQLHFISPI